MTHLSDEQLAQWAHGLLPADQVADAQRHLDGCDTCRTTLSALLASSLDVDQAATLVERTHLRDPALPAPGSKPGQLQRGAPLGRYLVLERIGEGAMGAVYAAYDPQLDRKVAVKLLGAALSRSKLAADRLVREARALARLAHPNVVAVHDVGTVDGQVFVAMHFVDGRTLRAELHEKERSTDDILRLLLDAGSGLAAAHRAGLVHRDFKPDNVLVSREGRVQVTDFGLARALNESDETVPSGAAVNLGSDAHALTATGELLGTPVYMSPEQLDGKPVDHRADQFSFCVTAWEALYGARPFAGPTLLKLRSTMDEGPPVPSSKRDVPDAIHRAILRGLSVDPAKRFASIDDLLDALSAQRPARTRLYASALAAAVLLGLLGLGWWLQRGPACPNPSEMLAGTWDEKVQRDIESAFTGTNSPLAGEAFTSTRAALERYVGSWSSMQRDACEATVVRHTQPESEWSMRRACLERRRTELQALAQALVAATAPTVERAALLANRLTPVEVCADVELLRNLQQVPENPEQRPLVDALHQRLARADAELLTRSTVEKPTLDGLVTDAEAARFDPLLAEVRLLEGKEAIERSQWVPAHQKLFSALLLAQESNNPVLAVDALTRLVDVELQQGHMDLARQWADLAAATLEPRAANEPLLVARVLLTQATVARRNQRFDEGTALATQALDGFLRLEGEESEWTASALQLLGAIAYESGDNASAEKHVRRCIAIRTRVLGPNHARVLGQRTTLAAVLKRLGRYDDALALLEQNVTAIERVAGPKDPRVAVAYLQLGSSHRSKGDLESAERSLRKAVALYRDIDGQSPADVSAAMNNLASVLSDQKKYDEASTLFEEAMALLLKVYPPTDVLVLNLEGNLADLDKDRGRYAQALERMLRVEVGQRKALKPQHPNHIIMMLNISRLYLELKKPDKALAWAEESASMLPQQPMPPIAETELRWCLARALWETNGDRARAKAELQKVDELLTTMKSPPDWVPQMQQWRAKRKA